MDWHLNDDNRQHKPMTKSSSPPVLLQFVGLIPADDLQKMAEAISSGCERIDWSEW